jgi:hypothetical protein
MHDQLLIGHVSPCQSDTNSTALNQIAHAVALYQNDLPVSSLFNLIPVCLQHEPFALRRHLCYLALSAVNNPGKA